jgi:hypothetical protein
MIGIETDFDRKAGAASRCSALLARVECPLCKSPARWVALLEQGGEVGKHIKRTITQTINLLLARESVLSGACLLEGKSNRTRLRGATRRFLTNADKMRAYRHASKALGLCSNCRRRKAKPGCAQCGECQKERARRKRMARRIGTKPCPCGKPAVNIWSGEYICADCMRREQANAAGELQPPPNNQK